MLQILYNREAGRQHLIVNIFLYAARRLIQRKYTMQPRRDSGRKYRLVDKSRFLFILIAAVLIFIASVYFFGGIGDKPGYAGNQVNAPAGTFRPDGRKTADATAGQNDDWKLVLVNTSHALPEGFQVETRELPNGLSIDKRAYDDLMDMIDDGQRQGLSLVVCSAYRSYDKQQELFDNKVARIQQEEGKSREQAYEEAQHTVALPGTSEHNLGLAADIVALSYQKLDEGYLNTPECKWLEENAYKYGFIMRYPEDKKEITKIIFEPWHYRYVGVEAAAGIKEKGQCLEEYLGMADES